MHLIPVSFHRCDLPVPNLIQTALVDVKKTPEALRDLVFAQDHSHDEESEGGGVDLLLVVRFLVRPLLPLLPALV